MRIHLSHDLDPLGRHSRGRGIAAKFLSGLATARIGRPSSLVRMLAQSSWLSRIGAGELIRRGVVAGLGHDPRCGLSQVRQIGRG